MLFTIEQVYIVTTKKKASYLEPLRGGKIPVEIFVRAKDAEENAKHFERCLDAAKKAGKKLGALSKAYASGPFVDEWNDAVEKVKDDLDTVDIAPALSAILASKDEVELRAIRDASRASSGLMKEFVTEEMAQIVDEEKKVTHARFAERINNKIDDPKYFQTKVKVSNSFDPSQLDWAFAPSVQSGGNYDLKLNAEPDDQNLHAGTLIGALGLRYSTYASLLARTYMVDPNKEQEQNYKLLLAARDGALKEIKDGASAKSVYERALGVIKAKKPELEKHFVRSVGAGIGIEAKDINLSLNAKSQRILRDGMTLALQVGFSDLENPKATDKKSQKYSLLIADTIRVTAGEPVIFTKDAGLDFDEDASWRFKEDESEEERPAKAKPKKDSRVGAVAQSNVTKTRLRGERATNQDQEKEAARREHQKEIHEKKHNEGLERYSEDAGALNGVEEKKFKKFESYKRDNQLPSRIKDLAICVDERAQSVVLPIMGRPVPFHVNTIKNASRTDEQGYTFLRINFLSPGQGVGRKEDQPFEDPNAHFVRSLTFRSKDMDRMDTITKQITELKKSTVRRENEKKEMEDVVEQDKLVEIRNRKPHRNEPVYIRPGLEGKRLPGSIEIHQNGLRYLHAAGQKVDILFSNVKHLFFQPCDHELIVIIHVHLVNPILIGKKKTKDVQFYREATDMAFDETGNRKRKHRYGDEEEFEQEQEERRRRAALNKEFKTFAERVSDAGRGESLSVDIPFRELGFNGVPSRSNTLIQPTTDCLVQLTEPPFLVITLSEIETVHLERVQFGLKNLDMVLIMRDFQKPVIHINTIPVESLDGVKDWLDSVDIPFSEGPLNLNWTQIMKTVTADPHAFFKEGGWSFLNTDSDEEGSEEESEESAFEVSEDEMADLSEEESDEGSDFDENASAEGEDDDASDDEEGEDWDEMEQKAKKKDRESGLEAEDSRKSSKGKKR